MKTLYDLLAVSSDADAKALKIAFRKAVKANHPDLHPEDPRVPAKFMQILAANRILSDAVQRAAYDQLLKLGRQQRRFEGGRLLISAVIVFTVALVGANWIRALSSPTLLTAINSNRGEARTEIVAADVGAETVGNSLYEGRNDRANVSTDAINIAPSFPNAGPTATLQTMVATAGTNDGRTQPIVDAVTAIKLALAPAGSVPAMTPQSVPTPVARVTHAPALLPPRTTSSSAQNSPDPLPARAAFRRLTIDAVRLRPTDALLTISAGDVGSDAAVVVGGLAPGTTLSTGAPVGPNVWRLSTEDLGEVVLTPPRGFVGAMDLSLELRLADQAAVDRKALQLEWSARDSLAPPKSERFGAPEIALMMEKGAALIGIGDVGGARMMFQPAAEAGDPTAAFALAETYDPSVLRILGVRGGITSDIPLANSWYEKARGLGSIVAPERLKSLAGPAN